ncbi:dimethylargininase [Promicromonospora thailandica]|uniref:N-Dimethylarginine dimethylaminohydrolase n=1 Tax=Promicromonospora thailandica TaxID=765201 RepID=A0A9X2G030_9MICO|nr:dimethylargininase [Promicromonospora thailandica]MCP2263213.1 N-Dimethylarginine dimethylaminohydrolase [Promicromonospora thailandica]BFF18601.1 arginine deiminase-related protein [Promicromonospora thailandica]
MTQTMVQRTATPRHYLMCPPTYFDVVYAINPWMDPSSPVDTTKALAQWEALRAAYQARGHRVDVIEPEPGLPDMVYAANGGIVVGGRALAARFTYPERAAEGPAYDRWFGSPAAEGYRRLGESVEIMEGEGDLLLIGRTLLAGTGFRTTPAGHAEVAERLELAEQGIELVPLELVDPRYYHLDTALSVLDDGAVSGEVVVAYHPEAFSTAAQETLRERFPDAILVGRQDAAVLGLNVVSDGLHVFLSDRAHDYAEALKERGFVPVGIDLSEIFKGGGSVKCCTLELRPETTTPSAVPALTGTALASAVVAGAVLADAAAVTAATTEETR